MIKWQRLVRNFTVGIATAIKQYDAQFQILRREKAADG
jgi:hypothetical protein